MWCSQFYSEGDSLIWSNHSKELLKRRKICGNPLKRYGLQHRYGLHECSVKICIPILRKYPLDTWRKENILSETIQKCIFVWIEWRKQHPGTPNPNSTTMASKRHNLVSLVIIICTCMVYVLSTPICYTTRLNWASSYGWFPDFGSRTTIQFIICPGSFAIQGWCYVQGLENAGLSCLLIALYTCVKICHGYF